MTPTPPSPRDAEYRLLTDGTTRLEVAAVSDRGPVRTENQDGWRVVPLAHRPGVALLLADGMGGHAGGGEAAAAALAAAAEVLETSVDPHAELVTAFAAADAAVGGLSSGGFSGTTLVGAVISEGRIRVANVGDSRAYVVGPEAVLVTEDHSLIEEQVRAGIVDAAQAALLPGRNILTRALTGRGEVPDIFDVRLAQGALLLLCSDGFWGVASDGDLLRLAASPAPLSDVADEACAAALTAGATDNVTLLVCRPA